MAWLLVALLSAVVAGVGLWRGTPAGLGGEAFPGAAGVLFSLAMYRASSLLKDRAQLAARGGWPLRAAGALCLTAALAGAADVGEWWWRSRSSVGHLALATAIAGFGLLAIGALRLSFESSRRTHFYALALASAGNAVAATWLLLSTQWPGSAG